jgi:hypothetical protein
MILLVLYSMFILSVSWNFGGDVVCDDATGECGRAYPLSDTGMGNVDATHVEWRLCHRGDLAGYLLAYCMLFPRALIIGYNAVAMYRDLFGMSVTNTLAFIVNYAMAASLAASLGSWRPGWPLNPVQLCDHSRAAPDPTMVSTLSFVFMVAITRHDRTMLGASRSTLLNLLALSALYVTAAVVNGYMYAWQAALSIALALALSAMWSVAAGLAMDGGVAGLSTSQFLHDRVIPERYYQAVDVYAQRCQTLVQRIGATTLNRSQWPLR